MEKEQPRVAKVREYPTEWTLYPEDEQELLERKRPRMETGVEFARPHSFDRPPALRVQAGRSWRSGGMY
jgi:hypothetical protein